MNNLQYPLKPAPQGMILIVTLIVMIIMVMMGVAIVTNTQTDLQISGNTNQGRASFTRADAGMNVAVQLVDILTGSRGVTTVCDILKDDDPTKTFYLDIEDCETLRTLQDSLSVPEDDDYYAGLTIGRRYGLAGSASEGDNIIRIKGRTHNSSGQVTGEETVATVVIFPEDPAKVTEDDDNTGFGAGWTPGASILDSTGQGSGGPVGDAVPRYFAITVNGRQPSPHTGNLFSDNTDAYLSGPQTIITVLYRTTIKE